MKKTLLPLGSVILIASTANAAILFSENFDGLTDGNVTGQNHWSGDGGSNADYVVAAAGGQSGFGTKSLFFEATGNTNTGQQRVFNTLDGVGGSIANGQNLYVGFAYRVVGDYSLQQVDDLLGPFNNAGNYKWSGNTNEFNNTTSAGGSTADDGTINYVVVEFVWDGGDSRWDGTNLWSTSDGTRPDVEGPVTSSNLNNTAGFDTWNDLYFNFGAAASVEAGDGYQIDNIVIATTAAEAEDYVYTAVPEPGTLALVSLALGTVFALRRRR